MVELEENPEQAWVMPEENLEEEERELGKPEELRGEHEQTYHPEREDPAGLGNPEE